MEIILIQNVAKIGQKGNVVNVTPGYAQFLINSGKAKNATKKAKENAEKTAKANAEKIQKEEDAIKTAIEGFKNDKLTIQAKASEKGHLFEGVSIETISEKLSEKLGIKIETSNIVLEHPLKEVGEHTLTITTSTWNGNVIILIEELK